MRRKTTIPRDSLAPRSQPGTALSRTKAESNEVTRGDSSSTADSAQTHSGGTHMMLALCTAVTLERPFLVAKSKANLAMRCDLARVMIFRHSMTPLALWKGRGV